MPRFKDIAVAQGTDANWSGAGTRYVVEANNGALYLVFIDMLDDVVFTKSFDDGVTWTQPVVVFAGQTTSLAIWYDRWSGLGTDLIHCVYTESVTDDTLYRTINTASSDALSTQTVVFAGTSTLAGHFLSVTRAVGGNVYCRTQIDAGSEGVFSQLVNANVPNGAWAARTINEAAATLDQIILHPDFDAADTQDILAIFWDASANEISRQLYDNSANSWAETTISGTTMTELGTGVAFPNFDAAPDVANTRSILVAWSNFDTNGADLRCWIVQAGSIVEVTNVVLNSTDDQGLCAIALDTVNGWWYVYYCGASDGSETWNTNLNVYFKVSKDDGTTWGAETRLTDLDNQMTYVIKCLYATTRFADKPRVMFCDDGVNGNMIVMPTNVVQPHATLMLGV